MKNTKVKSLVLIAILIAILAVGSQISVPMPFFVPITLQMLFVALLGYILSTKQATIAIFTYIVIGAVGIPVFANLGAGVGTLFSYTGGFIFGFLPLAILSSIGKGKIKILFGIIGLLICHFIGVLWYSTVSKTGILASILTVSLPYLLKDVFLVILAYFLSTLISKKIKKQG
jgi:biotin transport system substrate-specific component